MSLKGIKLCLVKMHFFSNKPFGKVKYLKYPGIFPQVSFLKCKFIQTSNHFISSKLAFCVWNVCYRGKICWNGEGGSS